MRPRGWKAVTVLAITAAAALAGGERASAQNTGILATKHNLSTSGTGAIHVTSGTAEVCVFCHTPHGADTTVAAPLWNRAINTTGAYTMYSSDTFDATIDSQPTGVSLACLSCHDGTIAFDALRNLPGPGGFSDNPTSAGWTFVGAAPGNKMPAGVTNLGTDLTNDHPISMIYSSAKSPSSTSGVNDHATGFKEPDPTGQFPNGVRLYAGKVQCASCHDPHRSDTPTFLRVSNAGSALCLTCHRKDG
jgi:predicted CXXCH cytochrome family protein